MIRPRRNDPETLASGEVIVGLAAAGLMVAAVVTHRVWNVAKPVANVCLRPPLVPPRWQPASWLADVGRRAAGRGRLAGEDLSAVLDLLVPAVTGQIVSRIDLTALVKQHVNLDAIVSTVDLDAAAARLDIDALLDRIDLNAVVAQRVDLNLLVGGVDLDAVAARLDIDGVVRTVDLDAVIARIDLVGLVEQVINAIDLPEIIRESTGSVASETVRGARMQGIAADDAIGRAVDRLFRRGRTPPTGPGEQP
jgi:hypothetical protein